MKKAEYLNRLRQAEYLDKVNRRFEDMRIALSKFSEIWGQDSDHGLDLNDYLTTMYPFPKSFDEFMIDFALWYGDGASKIVRAKHEIQPHWSEGRNLEEPEVEYETATIRKSQFSIDDGETYLDGYTYGALWNGWACPYFEYKECLEIAKKLNQIAEAYKSGEAVVYDKEKDAFIYQQEGEIWDDYEATTITYNGEEKKVYPLGAYGWVWWDKAWNSDIVEENWARYDTDETNGMGAKLDAEIHISEERMKEIERLRGIIRNREQREKKVITTGFSDKVEASMIRKRNKELTEAIEVLKGLLAPVYYVIKVYGDVEPELSVPSKTEDERDQVAKQMRSWDAKEEGAGYSGFYWLNIINGKPEIGSYCGAFFNDDENEDMVEEQRGEYNSPQTSMFTIEQMRGTGQLNILDQINEVADTKRRLKTQAITYWNDPGHGWYEVSYKDLVIINAHLLISGYSYRNGDAVYLEEDSDIVHYVKAIFGENYANDPMWEPWRSQIKNRYQENIFIRNLKHYRP